jgi:hypothetical protein
MALGGPGGWAWRSASATEGRSAVANNFTRWHVRIFVALWLAFAALTLGKLVGKLVSVQFSQGNVN